MHTCEIIASGTGPGDYELCGLPATKSVVSYCEASGAPCEEGRVTWLCDEHYLHASTEWKHACEF